MARRPQPRGSRPRKLSPARSSVFSLASALDRFAGLKQLVAQRAVLLGAAGILLAAIVIGGLAVLASSGGGEDKNPAEALGAHATATPTMTRTARAAATAAAQQTPQPGTTPAGGNVAAGSSGGAIGAGRTNPSTGGGSSSGGGSTNSVGSSSSGGTNSGGSSGTGGSTPAPTATIVIPPPTSTTELVLPTNTPVQAEPTATTVVAQPTATYVSPTSVPPTATPSKPQAISVSPSRLTSAEIKADVPITVTYDNFPPNNSVAVCVKGGPIPGCYGLGTITTDANGHASGTGALPEWIADYPNTYTIVAGQTSATLQITK